MASALDRLRKNKSSNLERLQKVVEETKSRKDDRFWKPTLMADKTAGALIRFLPPPDLDDRGTPWAKYFSHTFQNKNTGLWYYEKSRNTLGKEENDPVGDLNRVLYKSSEDEKSPARLQASAQKRATNIVSNILVISDEANPENNGKVFLFRFTKTIFDMIEGALSPKFADDIEMNPFDIDDGASFRIRGVEASAGKFNYIDYSKSSFQQPKPLFDNDEDIEKILGQTHPLFEFDDPSTFKSYEELERRLNVVLGRSNGTDETVQDKTESPRELRTASAPDTSKQESSRDERLEDPGDKTMEDMGDERPTPPPSDQNGVIEGGDDDDKKLKKFFEGVGE